MKNLRVDVSDFGAVPNIGDVQSKKFQDAIDYCYKNGGGEVVVPEGEYVIGDIRLRSNITLHLLKNARIKGSTEFKDYLNIYQDELEPLKDITMLLWKPPAERTPEYSRALMYSGTSLWNCGMIRIWGAENVSVIGEEGSVIDGRNCYNPQGEESYRGPHGISVHKSKDLYFSGYTIQNTGNWAHCIFDCQNIKVEKVNALAGHDGVHVRGCDNVTVKKCVLKTGDDSIAGFDNINVYVSDCYLSSACSVFRFGGRNVLIENCEAAGPCEYPFRGSLTPEEKANRAEDSETARKNTLSFYTYFVDHSRELRAMPENIVIRNCRITNADRMLRLNVSGIETWQKGTPPEDITFENVTADGVCLWMNAYGNDEHMFNLNMKNIDYTLRKGFEERSFILLGKYKHVLFENVTIHNFNGDALIKTWGDKSKICIKNLVCDGIEADKVIVEADDMFDINYI